MEIEFDDYQREALEKMKNGCILCGGTGSGKSRTSLMYYYEKVCKGAVIPDYIPMKTPKNLFIITTAKKRDEREWEEELEPFELDSNYISVKIDSWNNIKKYVDVKDSFFIFDEQRVVGYGTWAKSFIQIAKRNEWILLSATPGDTWSDYIAVFIANGFYKNKHQFEVEHVVWARSTKFPKIDRYINEQKLNKLRRYILVDMNYIKHTTQIHKNVNVEYDKDLYKFVMKNKWDVFSEKPIKSISELCYILRQISNNHPSRYEMVEKLSYLNKRVIIFYNFTYELNGLRKLNYLEGTVVAEWNGEVHEPVPDSERWVYLVQYSAGCEGWNCTETDTIIFFSQNYSYRVMTQAAGRIDRRSTKFDSLYYYHLKSFSPIDISIGRALSKKKNFNERAFAGSEK